MGAHSLPKTFSKIPRRKVVCNHIINCTRWESEWARGRGDCESDRAWSTGHRAAHRAAHEAALRAARARRALCARSSLLLTTHYYWLLLLATYYLRTKKPVETKMHTATSEMRSHLEQQHRALHHLSWYLGARGGGG